MESAVAYFKLLFIQHRHIFWTILNSMLKEVRNATHSTLVLVYTSLAVQFPLKPYSIVSHLFLLPQFQSSPR